MDRDCKQVNIPTVDNSQPDCEKIIKSQCVVTTKKRTTPVVINIGDDYEEVIDKMLYKIRELETRILDLEQ